MVLRGALNRGLNATLAAVVILADCLVICSVCSAAVAGRSALLVHSLAFLVGLLAGVPAYRMNRRALSELCDELNGKIFLSSQLALLDSRHGKNAVAYFYLVVSFAKVGAIFGGTFWAIFAGAVYTDLSTMPWGLFASGEYLSAHVLPFVFPPKR